MRIESLRLCAQGLYKLNSKSTECQTIGFSITEFYWYKKKSGYASLFVGLCLLSQAAEDGRTHHLLPPSCTVILGKESQEIRASEHGIGANRDPKRPPLWTDFNHGQSQFLISEGTSSIMIQMRFIKSTNVQ